MDTLPHHDCDCWRITEPLTGDASLPDHICYETEIGSVRAAMRDGVLPEAKWWPVTFDDGRSVRFVLRQWAEEPPTAALARVLGRELGWWELIWSIRGGTNLSPRNDAECATRLREIGLPDTPSTIRHLRVVAADPSHGPGGAPQGSLPTRGLLVTTFVCAIPPHRVAITGELDTTTTRLFEGAAAEIVGRHLHFATNVAGRARVADTRRHPIYAESAQRQRDYATAAWDERDLLRVIALQHQNDLEGALTEYLNDLYNRVRSRRKRAGVSTTVPADWRNDVKPRLRNWLRSPH
jgi:hypothetical protein